MRIKLAAIATLLFNLTHVAQNDVDALRYSQIGVGGNTRYMSMGGAFGALGANMGCLHNNPAGMALYRKGEMNFSVGLKFTNAKTSYNGDNENYFKPSAFFSGLGVVGAWNSKQSQDDRNTLGISISQLQDFNTGTYIKGRANGKSIMQDIIDNAGNSNVGNLDPNYSGLAFKTYLLDTINGKYYGFIDPSKNMLQSKSIVTSGKMNELALGYAYSYQDKLYLGVSLGVPIIDFTYNSVYKENDDQDSLRIDISKNTSTYNYPVYYYSGLGGFSSLSYNETYKTSGKGVNLRLGAIYRLSDYLRIGANYQSPSLLYLTDTYSYSMTTTWDEGATENASYPTNGGVYKYTIITPMRYGASLGFIYKKLFSIGLDCEEVNYSQSQITGASGDDFTGVNNTIRKKYSRATNLRTGIELNTKPVMVRLGYAMYGSPFGQTFTGSFVRNSFSGGIGFRNRNWVFDFGFVRTMSTDDYYLYNARFADKSIINLAATTIVGTVGLKF